MDSGLFRCPAFNDSGDKNALKGNSNLILYESWNETKSMLQGIEQCGLISTSTYLIMVFERQRALPTSDADSQTSPLARHLNLQLSGNCVITNKKPIFDMQLRAEWSTCIRLAEAAYNLCSVLQSTLNLTEINSDIRDRFCVHLLLMALGRRQAPVETSLLSKKNWVALW